MNNLSKNIYCVPLNQDDIKKISSDPETHVGDDEFAIDYTAPEGTDIHASATGKIIYVKDDSDQGGDDKKYEFFEFYNHIIIKHENGEYTECGHLKHKSAKKKVGDIVSTGDIIAEVGNTGYSECPHLHFSVFILEKMDQNFVILPKGKEYFINEPDFGFQTIKPRFK